MPTPVSDFASNAADQIAYAADKIGRSKQRAAVFEAICFGKKKRKTVADVVARTKLPRKRVLEEAAKLANAHLIEKAREDGAVVYYKLPALCANRKKILELAGSKEKLENYPTKVRPKTSGPTIKIELPADAVRARHISVDDIDAFAAVRNVADPTPRQPLPETVFKRGVQQVIGEEGTFSDWGGESNDLFTTRLDLIGKRRIGAFAFKGPGTSGKLTPGKMGKNGDQIQRLFQGPAEVFLVQYHGQIDQAVLDLMAQLAMAKSVSDGREVWYGVIDGRDTRRLIDAYPDAFNV